MRFEVDAQHSCGEFRRPRHISGIADPGVRDAQLADHLAEGVVDVLPAGAVVEQYCVFFAHRGPVDVMHLGIVEEIAEEAPGIRKDLSPFGGGVDLHRHAGQADRMVQTLTGRGAHERQAVAFADQELLAVGGEIKITGARHHRRCFVTRIVEIEDADGSFAVRRSVREEQLPLICDGQVREKSPGSRQLDRAPLEPN